MYKVVNNYTLSNDISIPCIGAGTWKYKDEVAYNSVKSALKAGYTHIDTAAVYDNEVEVGKAIYDSKISREKLFITTKLWNTVTDYEGTIHAFKKSLENLGLDYIDLYLIHWPNPVDCRENEKWKKRDIDCYKAMEDLYKQGKIKAIGVSNFLPHHLEVILDNCSIIPMVNQIRLFPGHIDETTVEFCQKHNILLEAYSPLGEGALLDNEDLMRIVANYPNKTAAQVALRWSLQRGFLPLPKSANNVRLAQNIDIFNFVISDEDMHKLNEIDHKCRMASYPDTALF